MLSAQVVLHPSSAVGCSRRTSATATTSRQQHRASTAAARARRRSTWAAVRAAAAQSDPEVAAAAAEDGGGGLQAAKLRLLAALDGTERGAEARVLRRGEIEEAQVAVESFSSGGELDFNLLQGRWRLVYTTASDVLPIVAPPPAGPLPPPLKFGEVRQDFTGTEGSGTVQNVIEATLQPPPGLPADLAVAVTLVVEAGWEARTARSIALTFKEAGFRDVRPSPALQNLLASPILPRGWWNQQLLLAIKQLSGRVPLTTRPAGTTSSDQRPIGINYMLTHLDDDMLIGRAQSNGGIFIFTRVVEDSITHDAAAATEA